MPIVECLITDQQMPKDHNTVDSRQNQRAVVHDWKGSDVDHEVVNGVGLKFLRTLNGSRAIGLSRSQTTTAQPDL